MRRSASSHLAVQLVTFGAAKPIFQHGALEKRVLIRHSVQKLIDHVPCQVLGARFVSRDMTPKTSVVENALEHFKVCLGYFTRLVREVAN